MTLKRPPNPVPERSRSSLRLAALLLATALVTGCATLRPPDPMTLEQVIELSKNGTPPEDIITRLQETRTVIAISGARFAKLRELGVDDSVLDYLQKSYVSAVEMEARMRYQNPYWGYGGWGPPYRPMFGPWPYRYYW